MIVQYIALSFAQRMEEYWMFFCITRNIKMTEDIVGPCLFKPFKTKNNVAWSYTSLTNNSFELDENMCGNARTGQMCGNALM